MENYEVIKNLKLDFNSDISLEKKFIGSVIFGLVGDGLGAPVEGHSSNSIRSKYGIITKFYSGKHMGLPKEPERKGMYTDDGNATLALLQSLVKEKCLHPYSAAMMYSVFFHSGTKRGAPKTAERIMIEIKNGRSYMETGRMVFKDGSFANGGAMRISPIGLLYKDVKSEKIFYEICRQAVISSHVHEEAVDGSVVIARMASYVVKLTKVSEFDGSALLSLLKSIVKTKKFKKNLELLGTYLKEIEKLNIKDEIDPKINDPIDDKFIKDNIESPGFQIKALDAVTIVVYAVLRYWKNPLNCVGKIINYGGDTDTLAIMGASIMGALYGSDIIPKYLWDGLENGKRGRDYAVNLCKKLIKIEVPSEGSEIIKFFKKVEEAERERINKGKKVIVVNVDQLDNWAKQYTLFKILTKMPQLAESRNKLSGLSKEEEKELGEVQKMEVKVNSEMNLSLQKILKLHYGVSVHINVEAVGIEVDKHLKVQNEKIPHSCGPKLKKIINKIKKRRMKKENVEYVEYEVGNIIAFDSINSPVKTFVLTVAPKALYSQTKHNVIFRHEKKFTEEKQKDLKKSYLNFFNYCKNKGYRKIAVDLFGSEGMFSFPRIHCAKFTCFIIREWLEKDNNYKCFDCIVLVTNSVENQHVYENVLQVFFPMEWIPKDNKK